MKLEKLSNVLAEQITGEWGEEGEDVAVLRTTNFTNEGRLNLVEVVRRSIPKEKILKKRLKLGDTIIEKSGGSPTQPVGRVVYFDVNGQDYLCNNFTSILRPSKDVDSRYFFWFLFGNHVSKRTLKYQNKTTGIINLKLERYLEETKIPVPPLPIQKKIAAILDKADSLRQKDKQLLETYNKLAQSIFYDMFGDPMRNEKGLPLSLFSEIVKNENYKRIPVKQSDRDKRDGIYPYYGATGQIDTIDDFLFDGEFLLIAEDGKNLLLRRKNNAFLVEGKFWVNNHAHVLSFNGICMLRYLEYVLNQLDLKPYVTGIDQFKLNRENLDRILVPIPPKATQELFDKIIRNLELEKKAVMKNINNSESLFQTLLQKAFKGELVKEP